MTTVQRSIDLQGQRFGRLIVLQRTNKPANVKSRDQYWLCLCDCGTQHVVSAKSLRHSGFQTGVQSCGCLQRERAAASASEKNATHGHTRGHHVTKEYRAWGLMIDRCERVKNRFYARYGGRGIKVCWRWRDSFEAFLEDVGKAPGPKYSLDRINNDGNYEPGNVRWATCKQQSRNRSDRQFVTFNSETMLLTDWAERLGIDFFTLHSRLKRGWSIERAFSTDPKLYHKRY